jgi:hypothetical protein
MPPLTRAIERKAFRLFKVVVATCSAGAAVVSILSFAQSRGLLKDSSIANAATNARFDVAWVGVTPSADTATAIGDTLHLTARVSDKSGGTVLGAPISWSSDSAAIASVSEDGTVIARAPGMTTIIAAIGAKVARAHVTVHQRVVGARVIADSGLRIRMGERRQLRGQAMDARGHVVERRPAVWAVADSTVARVDSSGNASAVAPGHTTVSLTVEGVTVRSELDVVDIPASIAAVTAAAQTAPAGRSLTRPIEVEVLSKSGQPVADVAVRFGGDSSDGRAEPATVQTDAKGRASARWTLGDAPGRQSIQIAVDGVSEPLVVFAEAEPVASNLRSVPLSDGPSGRVGEEVTGEVGLRLTDSLGRALPGVPVNWTARDGGSAVGLTPRTDSLGESRVHWTLGPKTGRQRAYASIGAGRAIPSVTISATALPGVPTATTVVGGAGQSGVVGGALSRPIVLRVTDVGGNPVAGATVSLLPAHGSVADSALVSDSSGIVRAAWTLGRSAGPQRLIARVAGVATPLTLTARARALGAANVAFPDSAIGGMAGHPLDGPVSVTVTDAYGNPVSDALVLFKADAGSVASTRVMSDAEGHAATKWRLGVTPGEQHLTASTKGVESKAVLTVVAEAPAAATPKPVAAKPAAKAPVKSLVASSAKTSSKSPAKSTAKPAPTSRSKTATKNAPTKNAPTKSAPQKAASSKSKHR